MADRATTETVEAVSSPTAMSEDIHVLVHRPAMTQVAFDEIHLKKEMDPKEPLKDRILKQIYCDKRRTWKLLSTYVPSVRFVRYYNIREYLLKDLMAGISVGVLHIPQALAFGLLASLKIQDGFFTSIYPVIMYLLFGTSPHVSFGTSAVICILVAGTVDRRNFTLDQVPEYLDYKESIAAGLSFITGIMLLCMGILRLGFITYYLPDSFFTGFTSAAAVHVGTSQLSTMLGLIIPKFPGVYKVPLAYKAMIEVIYKNQLGGCHYLYSARSHPHRTFRRHLRYCRIALWSLQTEALGWLFIGKVPNTLPPPQVPAAALAEASKYVSDCVVLTILIFAYTIALAKVCAKKHNYEVNDNQELIAYGLANLIPSFFFCFPACVAPPRTMVSSTMNAKTPLCGIVSVIIMIMFTLFIGFLFEQLPKPALAAIIFISLKNLYVQIVEFRKYWRINKYDFAIWFFTFFCTVFLDIDLGLFIGVGVSLVTVVFQSQSSRGFRMGKTLKDTALVEHKRYADSREIPGLKIFRFQSSLYFANAEIFRAFFTAKPSTLASFLSSCRSTKRL
ncbi:prestin-like [Pomacea canaliculata]|uniref:prestin-like n=1 Tax=Pomacea canaliculata TaxID=400727 RepID=UPI000D72B2E5|nr:prestin-like [Pomacea canaliculata]